MSADFSRIQDLIEDIDTDIKKFYQQKNQSAGRRIRRNMQEVKEIAQKIRLDVLKKSKRYSAVPTKPRQKSR